MGAILLSPLYFLLNLYLLNRILLWLTTIHPMLGHLWFVIPFIICYALLTLSPLAAAFGRRNFKALTRTISNYWLGLLMYLLIFLILFDLGRMLLCLLNRRSPFSPINPDSYRTSGIIILLGTLLLFVYGSLHAARIKKKQYTVVVNKTCEQPSLHIALLADLHLGGSVGIPHAQQIKQIIDKMHPDLIVFAGDIFDNDFDAIAHPARIASIFQTLTSTYGSFACWGNHDIDERILAGFTFSSGDLAVTSDPRMEQFLEDANIRLLKDETLLIDHSFYLIGRLDRSCPEKNKTVRQTAAELIRPLNTSRPVIVIDHQPSDLDALAASGADLVLSGHTHNGQLFPGNVTTKIFWRNSYGRLQIHNTTSIVTSGAGVWGPAMRIGTDSEVVEINVAFQTSASDPHTEK